MLTVSFLQHNKISIIVHVTEVAHGYKQMLIIGLLYKQIEVQTDEPSRFLKRRNYLWRTCASENVWNKKKR